MRVGFIGGVNSSFCTLQKLVEHNLDVVGVFGYKPSKHMIVSGYNDFEGFCSGNDIAYYPFTKINEHVELIKELNLDVLFVVGISQLISDDIIGAPKLGCIGYHPTLLPKGRGRAPIAWLVQEQQTGAANFFLITDEADAGPLFVQEPFEVLEGDDAASVEDKLLKSTAVALDKWLPKLKSGHWDPVPQDDNVATEYGVRKPDDGVIDWNLPSSEIIRLVRAAAPPHPGAYSFLNLDKIVVNKVELETSLNIKGCVGRVLKVADGKLLVQTGKGLVWLSHWESTGSSPRVGERLGYLPQDELYRIKLDIAEIKKKLGIENG